MCVVIEMFTFKNLVMKNYEERNWVTIDNKLSFKSHVTDSIKQKSLENFGTNPLGRKNIIKSLFSRHKGRYILVY